MTVTKLGYRLYGFDAYKNTNPRGDEYYWIGLHSLNFKEEENSDFNAIKSEYVSITPLKLDITAYETIDKIVVKYS